MPRDEARQINFTNHALKRLAERDRTEVEVEAAIRGGAWEANGLGRNGEPKWRVFIGPPTDLTGVVFVETTHQEHGETITTIEILLVITVMNKSGWR